MSRAAIIALVVIAIGCGDDAVAIPDAQISVHCSFTVYAWCNASIDNGPVVAIPSGTTHWFPVTLGVHMLTAYHPTGTQMCSVAIDCQPGTTYEWQVEDSPTDGIALVPVP